MRCPTLSELPPPPPDKTGWPWTEESLQSPTLAPDNSEWPCISVVTPSYNQGQFIEETIRSVLLQGYPNLEYIIIDGGSTDDTVDIIHRYEQWISYWVSEPDRGQTDAIQKGFERCTGAIWNWLNSDDLLELNALLLIAKANLQEPSATLYSGDLKVFENAKTSSKYLHPQAFKELSDLICVWENWGTPQPSMFMSYSSCLQVGGLQTTLKYAMDYDLYLKLALMPSFKVKYIESVIARFRLHSDSKTISQPIPFKTEIAFVFDEFASRHRSIMPNGWRASRARFQFHLALDRLGDRHKYGIPLIEFLQHSFCFLPYIWRYRFFWAYLFSYLKYPKSSPGVL
jgi:glycosyltransferase involved in cell wall biosynthesis